MVNKTLSDVVGQEISWDLGSRGILKGKLELRKGTKFVRYDSERKEINQEISIYCLVPEKSNFWYSLGVVGSPFDRGCTIDAENRISYAA